MHRDVVEFYLEVLELVHLRCLGGPVPVIGPVTGDIPQPFLGYPVAPLVRADDVGPTGVLQSRAKIVQGRGVDIRDE